MKNYLILIVTLFIGLQMFGQQEEWSVIAKKDVAFKAEQDAINLRGSDKDIKKFKIKCTQGSLKLKGVTIIYKDDTRDEKKPKGTGLLTKGMSSLTFGVDKDKVARKIELSYGAIGNMLITKRAKIEILGK